MLNLNRVSEASRLKSGKNRDGKSRDKFKHVLTMLEIAYILVYDGISDHLAGEILKWMAIQMEVNTLKALEAVNTAKKILDLPDIVSIAISASPSESGSNAEEDESKHLTEALLADEYAVEDEDGTHNTPEENQKRFEELNNQKATKSLADRYSDATIVPNGTLSLNQDQLDPGENGNAEKATEINRKPLLPVPMPSPFGYTTAILASELWSGLLHTCLRHNSQWSTVIPTFSIATKTIPSIQKDLHDIEHAKTSKAAFHSIKKFERKIATMDPDALDEVKTVLYGLQMAIYWFLHDNVTYSGYLGEGLSKGKMQVSFKVEDNEGNTKVMVVCVSDELYRYNPEDADPRDVRTITTVFFRSENAGIKKLLRRMY